MATVLMATKKKEKKKTSRPQKADVGRVESLSGRRTAR